MIGKQSMTEKEKSHLLKSTCHNAEIIGHLESPSGDPIRCSQCGEICGIRTQTTDLKKVMEKNIEEFGQRFPNKIASVIDDFGDSTKNEIKFFLASSNRALLAAIVEMVEKEKIYCEKYRVPENFYDKIIKKLKEAEL